MAEIPKAPIENFAEKDKQKVMGQHGRGAMFASIAQMSTFMAGILTAGAMGVLVPELASGGLGSIIAMTGATTPLGLAFLAVAAVATLVAVGSNMAAMKFNSSAYFDQSEANAKHNAKYIVMELKQDAACVQQEHPQNARADGKQWTQVVKANDTTVTQQPTR